MGSRFKVINKLQQIKQLIDLYILKADQSNTKIKNHNKKQQLANVLAQG